MKQLSLNEDEMQTIVRACRLVRLFSKHKTVASLMDYLLAEEIANRSEGKLHWNKPDLDLFQQVEDKFKVRLKEHGIE